MNFEDSLFNYTEILTDCLMTYMLKEKEQNTKIKKDIEDNDELYITLADKGFNTDQINQIIKAKANGLDFTNLPTTITAEQIRDLRIRNS